MGFYEMINDNPPLITGIPATNDILAEPWTDTASDFYIGFQTYE